MTLSLGSPRADIKVSSGVVQAYFWAHVSLGWMGMQTTWQQPVSLLVSSRYLWAGLKEDVNI